MNLTFASLSFELRAEFSAKTKTQGLDICQWDGSIRWIDISIRNQKDVAIDNPKALYKIIEDAFNAYLPNRPTYELLDWNALELKDWSGIGFNQGVVLPQERLLLNHPVMEWPPLGGQTIWLSDNKQRARIDYIIVFFGNYDKYNHDIHTILDEKYLNENFSDHVFTQIGDVETVQKNKKFTKIIDEVFKKIGLVFSKSFFFKITDDIWTANQALAQPTDNADLILSRLYDKL